MEFLAKTATFVLSVLASLFTTVGAPEAKPAVVPAVEMKPASFEIAEVPDVPSIALPSARVLFVVEKEPATNPSNELFVEFIKSAPGPKAPVQGTPWYLSTELFKRPNAQRAVRAFVSGENFSQ